MSLSRLWRRGGRRPSPGRPDGTDPELWAIFREHDPAHGAELLETAQNLRQWMHEHPPAPADPAFQGRLRANLISEARAGDRTPVRARRFVLPFSPGAGIAGLAVVAVVAAVVVALPLQRGEVKIQAAVAGHHELPVTQAIRISFNRPMDESKVLQGLTIKPAVSYQASWPNAETLVLSPAHGLAPNVGYVVTIAQPAVKAQNGAEAPTGIVIPFGTGSAPSTREGQIPTVLSVTQVPVSGGVPSVSYMPDGALLVQVAEAPPAPPASIPSPNPSPTPSPSGSTEGLTFGTVYVLTPALQVVATHAAGAVASPDSQEIAYWAPGGSGTLSLEVLSATGSGSPETLATSAESDPGLAWLDNGDLLYAAAGQLREVSLDGQVTTVDPNVQVDPSGFFTVSPSGQALFARPGGVSTIYSLPSGGATRLPDLVGTPAWAASGTDLAYLANSDGNYTVESTSDLGAQSSLLLTEPAGSQLSDLSFDPTGTYLTYVSTSSGLPSQVTALNVQSKVSGTLSNLTAVSDPVWDPTGNELSLLADVAGNEGIESLLLSGGPQVPATTDSATASALATASSLAQLQVGDGAAAASQIASLLAPGTVLAPSLLLPGKFDRFYAVSTTPTSAGASSYSVDLRLVRDATSSTGPAYLPEVVTVQTTGPTSLITAISPGVLTAVPRGPLVLSVMSSTDASGNTVFAIHFDSDLNPTTLGSQSITLAVGGHAVSDAQFSYSALTRTETVTVAGLPSGAVTLTVGPPLSDIDNTPMQSSYVVVLQPQTSAAG
jgi:hypothetical protein